MHRYIVRKLGSRRGSPRVYLDIHGMETIGFMPGQSYSRALDTGKKCLTLTPDPMGEFVVSRKEKSGKSLPIIDINSSKELCVFEGLEAVRVVFSANCIQILPIASEAKRVQRTARLQRNMDHGMITTAGISFGGGILDHAAHAGLHDAGLQAELLVANEIDEELLSHAMEHNDAWSPSSIALAAPMQEVVQDHAAMSRLPEVDLFCGGIPCSGASQAGKSKRGLTKMEDHPQVGHLICSAIMLINRMNPSVVVIENVPQYADTASAQILRHHLRDSGYDVQEVTLSASDFNCLENRTRWFLVAASRGIEIDVLSLKDGLPEEQRQRKTIASVLDPIGPEADDWRTFEYLKTKEVRDAEKGNSFAMQVITPESTSCPTLRKGYHKGGSTDPLLAHPTNPDLLRQLTVSEHARIKDVPAHLVHGMSKTQGHITLGQGIAYAPVRALFKRIGESLQRWKMSAASDCASSASAPSKTPIGQLLKVVG